jgi:hypothetical protein
MKERGPIIENKELGVRKKPRGCNAKNPKGCATGNGRQISL